MKVLVTGDRNWKDYYLIYQALRDAGATIVVHGGARGADIMAGDAAVVLGIPTHVYPAQWARYGRGAGPIRNKEQYDAEQPDIVFAFHNDLDSSKGTAHMVRYATSQGCDVVVHYQWLGTYTVKGNQ